MRCEYCTRKLGQREIAHGNAAAIICVHQHPTGDPSPNSEDISITRRLKEAGEIMGIKVLDHIIVGDGEYLSFVERGIL